MKSPLLKLASVALPLLAACRSHTESVAPEVEATSLAGRPLLRPAIEPERRAALKADLSDARAAYAADPTDELAAIWVGRRLGYLGRYRKAIGWYTKRLADFPDSYRLRRHRGHRLISVREFDLAIEDLLAARELMRGHPDDIEPDGAPNRYGLPRSSTGSNIRYHLALAFYLQGQFDLAAQVFADDARLAWNDDHLVAATNWLAASLRRAGRGAEALEVLAAIAPDMDVIENFGYYELCLLQKGAKTPSRVLGGGETDVVNATVAYGVANWRYCNGNVDEARRELEHIVANAPWNAFGTIAAEADLQRLTETPR